MLDCASSTSSAKKEDKLQNVEEPSEESIRNVMKFLKDKISGLNTESNGCQLKDFQI